MLEKQKCYQTLTLTLEYTEGKIIEKYCALILLFINPK